MGTLQFKRVTQNVENEVFNCGVAWINEYVKESYFPLITQQAYAYSISASDKVLGYYQVMFREIELQDLPEDISEYIDLKDKISAVHIRFIAIDEKYQNHKIGTNAIKIIIKDAEELVSSWPIRVVTIDARDDLVEWYKSLGFVAMSVNTPGQDVATTAMYFDCNKYTEELEEYIDSKY